MLEYSSKLEKRIILLEEQLRTMLGKKVITLGTLIGTGAVFALAPINSHAEKATEKIDQTIKEVGVDPDHPELQKDVNLVGVKQLELDYLKKENENKENLIKQHNNVVSEVEGKLKELEEKEALLKKETEELQKELDEKNRQKEDSTIGFDQNGLLIERTSENAERAISLLLGIPGHSNGSWYHQSTGLDNLIDQLSIPEAIHVIHRIEGAGFGQTGDGFAGYDTPTSHQNFIQRQVNNRFGGDVRLLLKSWGTYSYGGY